MRVALAQIDPTVGDIDGNAAKIAEWIGRARAEGADLAIFPELCLPGYPAEDLYLKRHFVEANRRAVEELAARGERPDGAGRLRRATASFFFFFFYLTVTARRISLTPSSSPMITTP